METKNNVSKNNMFVNSIRVVASLDFFCHGESQENYILIEKLIKINIKR